MVKMAFKRENVCYVLALQPLLTGKEIFQSSLWAMATKRRAKNSAQQQETGKQNVRVSHHITMEVSSLISSSLSKT